MARRIVAFVGSRDLPARYRAEVTRAVSYELANGADIWTGDCKTGVDAWVREHVEMSGAVLRMRVFVPLGSDIKNYGYRAALAMRAERIADELDEEAQQGADVMVRAWSRPHNGSDPTPGTARTTNRAKRYGLPVDVQLRGEPRR